MSKVEDDARAYLCSATDQDTHQYRLIQDLLNEIERMRKTYQRERETIFESFNRDLRRQAKIHR